MDMLRTSDPKEFRAKERAKVILVNYLRNAATKTNLEMRVGDAPVAIEDKLQATMGKLTSYTTMFYQQVFRRNLHTAAPAAIVGMVMSYIAMEQLYAKLMDLARGRSIDEILEEYREDPVGSLISATSRLPFMGLSAFLISGLVDKARAYLGRYDLGIGYSDVVTSPNLIGLSGAEVSLNGFFRGLSNLITIPSELLLDGEVSRSRYFSAARAIPVPLRPVVAAAVGVIMAEESMGNRGGRYMNSYNLLNSAGFMESQPEAPRVRRAREQRRKAVDARRRQFADNLRGTTKSRPKAPETPPPAPSRQATDAISLPKDVELDRGPISTEGTIFD